MTLNTWNCHRGTKIREQVDKSLKLYMNKHLKSHLLVHLWSISVSLLFVDLTVEAPLCPHYTFTTVICVGSHPVCCNGDPLTQFYFMRNGQREMEANLECSWSSVCVGKKTKQKQKAAFPCALSWHRMACCMQSSSYHSLWMSSFSGHHCNTTVMCSVSTRGVRNSSENYRKLLSYGWRPRSHHLCCVVAVIYLRKGEKFKTKNCLPEKMILSYRGWSQWGFTVNEDMQ